MVEIDTGDDGDDRRKNVGGVEPATEADFEDGEFHPLAGKILESHGGDALEVSGMGAQFAGGEEFFNQQVDAREGFGEGFVADLPAIDADALVDFFEVGRSIQTGSKASMAKDGFEERGGRAFAVGSGEVSARIRALGFTERLESNSHGGASEL